MSIKKYIARRLRPFVDKNCPPPPQLAVPMAVVKEHIAFEKIRCCIALDVRQAEGLVHSNAGPLKEGALFFRDSIYDNARRTATELIMQKLVNDRFVKFELGEDGCEYRATLYAIKPDDIKEGRKQLEVEFEPTGPLFK